MGQQQSRGGSFVSSPSSLTLGNSLSVLHVEVVSARRLGRPSYRTSDLLKAFNGCAGRPRSLNPYVEIRFGRNCCCTPTLNADEEGNVDFGGAAVLFSLDRPHTMSCISSLHGDSPCQEVTARAFDQRRWGVRGNALIGEAKIRLEYLDMCGKQKRIRLRLRRRGKERGELLLRYSVRPATDAYSVLTNTGKHRLVDVADALSQILSGPDGLDILLNALPHDLAPPGGERRTHEVLQRLLKSLVNQVGMLASEGSESLSDAEVLERFARLSHSMQSFVSNCVAGAEPSRPGGGASVLVFTEQWIQAIFNACLQRSDMLTGVMPRLRDERLKLFIAAGRQFPALDDLVPCDANGRVADRWRGWRMAGVPGTVPKSALLGDGAQGEVWRAKAMRTGDKYAVKVKSSRKGMDPAFKREQELVDHILMAPHPCIVELVGAFYCEPGNQTFIVMELCDAGDLHGRIEHLAEQAGADDYRAPAEAQSWIAQIFLGLEHLHLKLKSLCRDLKPQNVVLTQHGRAKLTDFGHGRIGAHAPGDFTLHYGPPGSPHFVAPEVVLKKPYDWKVDLYSFGVLIWVILTGGLLETPALPPCREMTREADFAVFATNCRMLDQCVRDPTACCAREMPSSESASLVQGLVQESPSRRLGHEKIRAHPFMRAMRLPPPGSKAEVIEHWLRSGSNSLLACSGLTSPAGAWPEASASSQGPPSCESEVDDLRARLLLGSCSM